MTKSLNDDSLHDITPLYKMTEGDSVERLALFNAVRGNARARQIYSYQVGSWIFLLNSKLLFLKSSSNFAFALEEIKTAIFGENFQAKVTVEVRVFY